MRLQSFKRSTIFYKFQNDNFGPNQSTSFIFVAFLKHPTVLCFYAQHQYLFCSPLLTFFRRLTTSPCILYLCSIYLCLSCHPTTAHWFHHLNRELSWEIIEKHQIKFVWCLECHPQTFVRFKWRAFWFYFPFSSNVCSFFRLFWGVSQSMIR